VEYVYQDETRLLETVTLLLVQRNYINKRAGTSLITVRTTVINKILPARKTVRYPVYSLLGSHAPYRKHLCLCEILADVSLSFF